MTSQRTPPASEWHKARRGAITGTDAARIMGYGSGFTVWADKQGYLPPTEESEAMYWGNRLEPVVIEEWARRSGHEILNPWEIGEVPSVRLWLKDDRGNTRLVLQSRSDPWALCTPDALYRHKDTGELGVLEVKTTGFHKGVDWEEDRAPMPAQVQLQWNVAVAGVKHGGLGCLIGGQRFVGYETEPNARLIGVMMGRCQTFHVKHVMPVDAPPPVPGPHDMGMVRLLAGKENGQTVRLPDEALEVHERLLRAEEALAVADEEVESCRAKIIAWIGENSVGEIPGVCLYTYHTQERGLTEFRQLRRRQIR